jgi:hypothetical protein
MVIPNASAIATLRQLAVLGLPGAMLHETIAAVMRRLVSCDLVAFQELDHAGNLAGAWINYPDMMPELGATLSDSTTRSRPRKARLRPVCIPSPSADTSRCRYVCWSRRR